MVNNHVVTVVTAVAKVLEAGPQLLIGTLCTMLAALSWKDFTLFSLTLLRYP